MSTFLLRNNRQRCEALTATDSQCENKTQNCNNNDLTILNSHNDKALQPTQTNSIKSITEKNSNQKYCKKCFKKDSSKESVILQKKISSTNKRESGTKRRIYSSSESETYQNQQNNFFKLNKRSRYNNQSKLTICLRRKGADVSEIDEKNKSHSKAPQAPSNTTQFLITDREERESSERDIIYEQITVSTPATPSHQLDYSPGTSNSLLKKQLNCQTMTTCSCVFSLPDSTKYNDNENTENPEFTAVYDDFNFERIKRMPRDEVNQEMLITQKNNFYLNEKVDFLKSENDRLRSLLNEHGIKFSDQSELNFFKFGFKLPYNSSTSSSSSQHESQISTESFDESDLVCNNDNTKAEL